MGYSDAQFRTFPYYVSPLIKVFVCFKPRFYIYRAPRAIFRTIASLIILLAGIAPQDSAAQNITITNPGPGVNWYRGLIHRITWFSHDTPQPVNIYLVQNDKEIEQINKQPEPTKLKEGGFFDWHIASDIPDGTYAVRVRTANTKETATSSAFNISSPKIGQKPKRFGLPEMGDAEKATVPKMYQVDVLDIMKIWSQQCIAHAKAAIYRQAINVNYECGLTGPEWSNSYQAHYDWCMQQHLSQQSNNIEARDTTMSKQLNACSSTIAMRVQLTKLIVHDDCDNVSDGDWYVSLVSTGTVPGSGNDFEVWPNRNSASNVDTGGTYNLYMENVLILKGTSNLQIRVGAVDCDGSPGHWFWPLVGVPIPPVASSFAPYESSLAESVDCDDEEEFWELSGANDFLGYELLELKPQQWQAGGNFKIVAGAKAIQQCESDGPPYTAYITVKRVFPKP